MKTVHKFKCPKCSWQKDIELEISEGERVRVFKQKCGYCPVVATFEYRPNTAVLKDETGGSVGIVRTGVRE